MLVATAPTATTGDPGVEAALVVAALLLAGVVTATTVAAADLLDQRRRAAREAPEHARGPLGQDHRDRGRPTSEQGAGARAPRLGRAACAVVLADVMAVGLAVLALTGATATSRPLVVGLVCGVVGCAVLAATVLGLVALLQRRGGEVPARSHPPAPGRAPLAAVPAAAGATDPRPVQAVGTARAVAGERAVGGAGRRAGAPESELGTAGARGLSAARARARARAERRADRERRRGQQRRQTVSAVEVVLGGRGLGVEVPAAPSSVPADGTEGPLGPARPVRGAGPTGSSGTASRRSAARSARAATARARTVNAPGDLGETSGGG